MAEMFLLIGMGVALLILLIVFAYFIYSGLFHSINIGTGKPPIGKTVIAYKFGQGPYKKAGNLFSEVYRVVPSIKKSVGIYYDDTNTVEEDKCRFAVGAILAEGKENVDEEVKKQFEDVGFKTFTLPPVSHSIRTTFPYRNTLSMFIAMFRVYPKISAFIEEKGLGAHPCIEIYDGKNIEYMVPLREDDGFYVEEAKGY